jgi:hypothetical protein
MDDLLVSAPDLDYLGWNRTPTSFGLASIGISIPRTDDWSLKPAASASDVSFFADAPAVSRVLRARRTQMVPPGGALMVEVTGAETLPEGAWATQEAGSFGTGLEMPEGPIAPGQRMMAVTNSSDETVEIEAGAPLFSFGPAGEEENSLCQVLDSEAFSEASDEEEDGEEEKFGEDFAMNSLRQRSQAFASSQGRPGATTSSSSRQVPGALRWAMLVLALLFLVPATAEAHQVTDGSERQQWTQRNQGSRTRLFTLTFRPMIIAKLWRRLWTVRKMSATSICLMVNLLSFGP